MSSGTNEPIVDGANVAEDAEIRDGFAEASLMLSSALEQLDGIIAGTTTDVYYKGAKISDTYSTKAPSSILKKRRENGETVDVTTNSTNHWTDRNGNYNSHQHTFRPIETVAASNGVRIGNGVPAASTTLTNDVAENGERMCKSMTNESTTTVLPLPRSELCQLADRLAIQIKSENKPPLLPDFEQRKELIKWLAPGRSKMKLERAQLTKDDERSPSPSMSTVSCPEYGELQDKLHRLEADRESLSLQVSVLSEQVGAQTEKIRDLESMLDDKRQKLDNTEEMLQEEFVSRSTLETSKLDLMGEVSKLKVKFAALERDKYDTEQRLRVAQQEINKMHQVMSRRAAGGVAIPQFGRPANGSFDQITEVDQLRMAVQHLISENAGKNQEIENLKILMNQVTRSAGRLRFDGTANHVDDFPPAVVAAHHSSGSSGTLPRSISGYAAQDFVGGGADFDINQQLRKLLNEDEDDESDLPPSASYSEGFGAYSTAPRTPTHHTAHYGANAQLSAGQHAATAGYLAASGIQSSSSYTSSLSAMSRESPNNTASSLGGTPKHHQLNANTSGSSLPKRQHSPSGGATRPAMGAQQAAAMRGGQQQFTSSPLSTIPGSPAAARQLASELDQIRRSGTRTPLGFSTSASQQQHPLGPPAYYTGSLPRNFDGKKALSTMTLPRKKPSTASSASGIATGGGGNLTGEWSRPPKPPHGARRGGGGQGRLKGWFRRQLRPGKRSTSAPNLVESDDETLRSAKAYNQKFKRDKKQRSLRNLLGKLKRSSSQELNRADFGSGLGTTSDSYFKRGVLTRATAAPRLQQAWPTTNGGGVVQLRPPVQLFFQWNNEQLCQWIAELGLHMYAGEVRKCVQSGRHLLSMGQHEMEKDLGIKSSLHRKKLKLALKAIEEGKSESWDRMDYHQVLRWLDDIGLPQYREMFAEALIDGQMLVALTVDDLLQMKVTLALHHATLSRGIELLKKLGFSTNRIHRKFDQESISRSPCPHVVELWSQHCVSEWLRTIDLSEFTPNLMCAGIHGALLVLEPTFTAESLADVLQMAREKTLLRRHLVTQFNQLLGQDVIAHKRDVLSQPYVVQLSPLVKVKPLKKGFSLARKKNKNEVLCEPDELVCSVLSISGGGSSSVSRRAGSKSRPATVSSSSSNETDPTINISQTALEKLTSSNV